MHFLLERFFFLPKEWHDISHGRRHLSVSERLNAVLEEIHEVCQRERISPSGVTIVGVTKGKSVHLIQQAFQAGLRHFGENYWQEARRKFLELGMGEWKEEENLRKFVPQDFNLPFHWHFIGRLQKNKIKDIVKFFEFIQSVDSMDQLNEIEKRASRLIQVLVQVNLFDEPQKGGIKLEEVPDFIEKAVNLKRVRIVGLMSMAKEKAKEADLRRKYSQLRRLFEKMQEKQSDNIKMLYLSMGTSQDFSIAIACGANMLRLGTILFGRRNT